MKKIFYLSILLFAYGCSGFLDEVSQDKLVPKTTDQFAALLLQEFNSDYAMFRYVDYMTDNLVEKSSASTTNKKPFKTTFTWQREIEIDEDGGVNNEINQVWQNAYKDIAVANYVIELIDKATGTAAEIKSVKGEAYFIRAFSYFNLLNLYGQPYHPNTASSDLGVPLRINVGIESTYSRNTVAECYQQIQSDLQNARALLEQSGVKKSIWHPTVKACDLLLSRVNLYQEKWDETIDAATKTITGGTLELMTGDHQFLFSSNSEVVFSFHTTNPLYVVYTTVGSTPASYYKVSENLINQYDPQDNRLKSFFIVNQDADGTTYQCVKYTKDYYTQVGYNNFRLAEAYLNRAEAYAQKGDIAHALADIKELIAYRYSVPSVVTYPTSQEDVLAFVLKERRKELCFEDHHRWFDLRRMKNSPEIKHTFTLVSTDGTKTGTETYTLLSSDPNYTLPIPLKERENNAFIRNNERFEKLPVLQSDNSF